MFVVYLESDLRKHRLCSGEVGQGGKEVHAGCANEEMDSVSKWE